MEIPTLELEKVLLKACEFLKEEIQKELLAQGHKATGNLINSVEVRIKKSDAGFVGQIWLNDYGFILNDGVKPSRVPYSRGSGAKSSRYIDALINWAGIVKPSLNAKERKSFAFAVANKAKKEGHPTRGSFEFSQNGRRKEWAKYAIDNNIGKFEDLLNLSEFMAILFDNFVTQQQRLIIT